MRRPGGAVAPAMKAATGFLQFVLDPLRSFLFRGAADLADQNHGIRLRIVVEKFHRIEMRHPVDRIASDADAGGLAVAARGELPDRFVGQRPGA